VEGEEIDPKVMLDRLLLLPAPQRMEGLEEGEVPPVGDEGCCPADFRVIFSFLGTVGAPRGLDGGLDELLVDLLGG